MTEDAESTGPIKVMLVDDQHLLRMGFKLILEGEDDLEVVAEAADGQEALALLESLGDAGPDVILMDVRMPKMDGIAATRRIAELDCAAKVIILTTFDLDEYAFSGLQAGASAFLLKDVEPQELVNAVRVVSAGDAVVAPRITQRLLEVYLRKGEAPSAHVAQAIDAASSGAGASPSAAQPASAPTVATAQGTQGTASTHGTTKPPAALSGADIANALDDGVPREPLTARETEVLFAVAEGLSNAEIASKFFLSEATVKTHVRRILTKLQLRDRVQAVVYVYQAGLVDNDS